MRERLQKLMAQAGLGSRRANEELIRAGRVRVNGRLAKLGDKADPDIDRIEVDGQSLNLEAEKRIYIALHKPKDVISSLEDELGQGRRTVRDLVDVPGHLYPVGRLDRQSTGLMLMTNDGQLAHKLSHPRYGHEKTYRVVVEGRITPQLIRRWRRGVWLDDRKTAPAKIRVIHQESAFTQLEIVMREGRKRQIRRTASLLGHPVSQLVREKIGPLALGDLKAGQWRHLTAQEVADLRKTVLADPPPRFRRSQSQTKSKKKGRRRSRK